MNPLVVPNVFGPLAGPDSTVLLDQNYNYLSTILLDSIATLRLTTPKTTSVQAPRLFVSGYASPGDGGGGWYWFNAADTTSPDNGGSIIVASDGGRWYLISPQKQFSIVQFGADPTGVSDSTSAIANAVAATPKGGCLYYPPGAYKISSQINHLQQICVWAFPGTVTIILATQNQNGFVFGDGTSGTRANMFTSAMYNIAFNPLQGIAASTSGVAVFFNFISNFDMRGCTIYGTDSSLTPKLFEGVRAFQTLETNIINCYFRYLGGIGTNCFGTAGLANATSNVRMDYNEWTNIAGDCVYLGLNAIGNTINFPVMYKNTGSSLIHVDVTTSPSTSSLIFVNQLDLENDETGATAINYTNGNSLNVTGGWIGGNTTTKAVNVASVASGLRMEGVLVNAGGGVVLSGPDCSIVGCDVVGDNVTASNGITINSGASLTIIEGCRVSQWPTTGIIGVGNPTNCRVDAVFSANGTDISGLTAASGAGCVFGPCATDKSFSITPAASISLTPGKSFYQLSGSATNITNMTTLGLGFRVTFQAQDAAGDTFANGSGSGAILLKTSPTTIPQFHTMSFVCDGIGNWYEDGRSF